MTDLPNRLDVINCYRLALGRDPETEAVIEDKLRQPRSGLLPDFFSSSEFDEGVRIDVLQGSPPQPGLRLPPSAELRAWAATFAPLSHKGAEAIKAAESWPGVYRSLFADDVFAANVLSDAARTKNPAFLSALMAREQVEAVSRIEGRIELVTRHEIRGWALNQSDAWRRLGLELWIDGAFRAAVTTSLYRRELQERFGGNGMFGFAMSRPPEPQGSQAVRAELRESCSGAVVDTLLLEPVGPPPADAAVALRGELAQVRALLARIEAGLPNASEAYSFDLSLYADYFDAYYARAELAMSKGPPLGELVALVDASSATPAELHGTLASLAAQGRPPHGVVVIHPGGSLALDYDHVLSLWRGRFGDIQAPRSVLVDAGWTAALQTAVATAGAPYLIFLKAPTRLAPEASEVITAALQAGAALVYADSDAVELLPDEKVGRRFAPAFRASFDADLFLQTGDLGPLLGLSQRFINAVGLRPERDATGLYDLILRGLHRPDVGEFVHVPRILSHAAGAVRLAETDARRATLDDYLAEQHPGAETSPHTDVLDAGLPVALRVRYAVPAKTRAAVIVPTRDRLDLLQPCLEKLAILAGHNQTRLEILVVDNQSCEPETFAFLEHFNRVHPLRIIPHDGTFNWALMNNRAAAQSDADVLIFLNNDTVALTPDWCDELCSQALRPDVGAVGARLLYGDGTIQHAGVVTGGLHAFTAHEGVGAPGHDPGHLGRHALLRQASAVTGACLATSRLVFERLKGFDAVHLPVESNDTDYCFRVRAIGLKVLYDPYCTLYHYESKSRGFNIDAEKYGKAEAASSVIRARWQDAYRVDPFYNPHFDLLSPPFTRLRPPPAAPKSDA